MTAQLTVAPPAHVSSQGIPSKMIEYAMQQGADIEKLEQLFALQQKYEANEARKAYVKAMADFKRNAPEITKDKQVSFKTEKGLTEYMHATIGNVVEKIVGALAMFGFSHRWDIKRGEGGLIVVTCVVTHELGHFEETTLEAGLDTSGGKNNIQAMISTKTYLERHSLLAATGLATKDQVDDDGRGAEPKGMPAEREGELAKAIKAETTKAGAKKAWQAAVKECEAVSDVAAANRLKEIMLAHAATLDKPTENKDAAGNE